jgi:hypothetical protein
MISADQSESNLFEGRPPVEKSRPDGVRFIRQSAATCMVNNVSGFESRSGVVTSMSPTEVAAWTEQGRDSVSRLYHSFLDSCILCCLFVTEEACPTIFNHLIM